MSGAFDVASWKKALPTPRHEDWKYTSLAPLKQADVAPRAVAPVIVATGATVEVRGAETAAADDVVVQLDETVHIDVRESGAIRITHATPAGALTGARIHVRVAPGAKATIVETFAGEGVCVHVPATVIDVGPSATVSYLRVVEDAPQAFHLGRVEASVARDATLGLVSVLLGGRVTRARIDVTLAEGATVAMDGLALAGKDTLLDHHTFVDHAAPRATTREAFRAAVDAGGRAVFTGKIVVREGSDGTDASQHTRSLLLAEDAQANARPQLEILADDVKCAHGAAVGRLDEEALFYLRQRGLGPVDARRLLVRAFASESLAAIADEAVRAEVDARVDAWLARWEGT